MALENKMIGASTFCNGKNDKKLTIQRQGECGI